MGRLKVALLFLMGVQSWPALAADPIALNFKTYSGYFVSNKFEPDAAESFVVITDQKQFDQVFGVAMVMGDKSQRLSKDAFLLKMVVAAIRRGNAVWTFKVEGVTVNDGVVRLQYASKVKKSVFATMTFACPLIVSIPKGNYRAVEFIENTKLMKTVEIEEKRIEAGKKAKTIPNRPIEPLIPPAPDLSQPGF
jgi:hypothetical protein